MKWNRRWVGELVLVVGQVNRHGLATGACHQFFIIPQDDVRRKIFVRGNCAGALLRCSLPARFFHNRCLCPLKLTAPRRHFSPDFRNRSCTKLSVSGAAGR